MRNYENDLPNGYSLAMHIDATKPKFGIIFNLIAFIVCIIVMICAFIPLTLNDVSIIDAWTSDNLFEMLLPLVVVVISMCLYMVLHELVHGLAYKLLTRQKLTFGMSWSCAFCGVPEIYTYRKTALISVSLPLIVFSVVLCITTALLYFVSPIYYVISAFIFGLHLGGCSGDIYVIFLLIKFKSPKTLMRDTGPQQYFYLPTEQA